MQPLRILWVLPYLPWPTTSGGKLRQYHLLYRLAERGHRITLLVQSKLPLDEDARAHLEPILERLVYLPRRPLKSFRTLLSALVSPLPLLASVNGYAPALSRRLDKLLNETWDVVQIEHSYTFPSCEAPLQRSRRPFLLSEHNVESTLSETTYARLPAILRPFALLDRGRYRRWERHVLSMAQRVIALTEDDARVFSTIAPGRVEIVVNGTDTGAFAEVVPAYTAARVLFVGNFEYMPNVEAVAWMLDEVMPVVWRDHPQARVCLCGHALPGDWRLRWPDARIEWRGFVDDLCHVQRGSSVFLAALRDGGGSKLKVLEAMAAGLPLVATAQAMSGLDVHEGTHYLGGEETEALAAALAQLLADPELARRIGEAGRGYVRKYHDWNRSVDQLEAVYAGLACG